MLPLREYSGKRAVATHRQVNYNPRKVSFLVLGLLFFVYMYFNVRFLATSTNLTNSVEAPGQEWSFSATNRGGEEEKTLVDRFATRQVKHLVFTSTCRDLDFVHAEVLAFTLRRTGYDGNITHLLYGCTDIEASELTRKKNSQHSVQTRCYPEISASNTTFGEKLLTTTFNPIVLARWMLSTIADGNSDTKRDGLFEEQYALSSDDYIMVVDSDAIFTKKIDLWNLLAEVKNAIDPRIFGQDASWYWPKRFPLTKDQLKRVVPTNSRALLLEDWREYASIAPFVAEVSAWKEILPTAVDLWSKLSHEQLYLAIPIAAAHEKIAVGISGVLSVHHYPSRYQNWDFVDDIKHNPCDERAEGTNLALSSYPISIRALNFTLPQWIDGRDWSFFADKIPSDFFSCDAWMMHQPSSYLWHLASNTSGYERVPNILRRRHTMSVCLAVEAYNSASENYRSRVCPTGFNHNRRIPMALRNETWNTAIPLAEGTPMEKDPPVYFGNYKPIEAKLALNPDIKGSDDVHFVFTTSCEQYQDWQSEALAQSFARVGQRGALTRIVSGCSDTILKDLVRRTRKSSPHLRIHVTRDFSSIPMLQTDNSKGENASFPDAYVPYNKPFGLRDWLATANPPVREKLLVVLDPDFLFLRTFAVNFGGRVTTAKGVDSGDYEHDAEVIEGMRQYKRFFVYAGFRDNVSDTVVDGAAVAQRWTKYLKSLAFINSSAICPECANVSETDALEYYSVGPPYALTRTDLMEMVDDYCNMTLLKREQNREYWMNEMLGYSLAAAKHNIKHTAFDNLALSKKSDDYTGFIKMVKGNPCEDPVIPLIPSEAPPLLHGCHLYEMVDDRGLNWIYYKQLMPNNLFACDSWLLATPPASIWSIAKRSHDEHKMLEAFGLCTSIKVINQALVDFKTKMCPDGFNQNRRLRLVKKFREDLLEVGKVHKPWQDAADENAREGA
ncbi:hypothetical protein CCR75_002804 [Bremia lactucae]|uniref:Uncharacterized protein n=1 Tax=Bremia lactucae TaxID=4779 RepID=A0A976FR48_BRELC|nr:hypothetical protein CCR75_002804 [Bremia lactucae]